MRVWFQVPSTVSLQAVEQRKYAADQLVAQAGAGLVEAERAIGGELLEVEQHVGAVQLVDVPGVELGHRQERSSASRAVNDCEPPMTSLTSGEKMSTEPPKVARRAGRLARARGPRPRRRWSRTRKNERRVVGSGHWRRPRDAVVGDVVFAVLEAAQRALGLDRPAAPLDEVPETLGERLTIWT